MSLKLNKNLTEFIYDEAFIDLWLQFSVSVVSFGDVDMTSAFKRSRHPMGAFYYIFLPSILFPIKWIVFSVS